MLLAAVAAALLGGVCAVAAYIGLRFPGKPRAAVFVLAGWLQGLETRIITNAEEMIAILSHGEDKGRTVEETIMLPTWLDGASVESVNGARWRQLRHSFNHFHAQLPPIHKLEEIMLHLDVAEVVRSCQAAAAASTVGESESETASREPGSHEAKAANPIIVIDSPAVSRAAIAGFGEWLLGHKPAPRFINAVYQMMVEIRGELAMRRAGRAELKRRGNAAVVQMLENTDYVPPPGRRWADRDVFPAVLQPYFVSPAVNLPDIFIALDHLCPDLVARGRQWQQQGGFEAHHETIGAHLFEAMRLKHPFPVLERLHGRTQYFLALDEMYPQGSPAAVFRPEAWRKGEAASAAETASVDADAAGGFTLTPAMANVIFGVGPRRCPGKAIAMGAMSALLYNMLTCGLEFQPALHHRHSGRIHDDAPAPLSEHLHMLWRVVKALAQLAFTQRPVEFAPEAVVAGEKKTR